MAAFLGYGYDYGYFGDSFGDSDFTAGLGMLFGFIMVIMLIAWASSLVFYILRSIGLQKLSANRGMSGAGLAWIPFVGSYRIGAIADDISARNGSKSYYRYILLIGGIINTLGGVASGVLSAMLNGAWFSRLFDGYHPYSRHYSGFSGNFAYLGSSAITSLISLAVFVLTVIALNIIYKCYRPMSSTSWTVLSVIFPFMQSIFPFVIRNAVPVSEYGAQGYYPPQKQEGWQPPSPPQYPPYGQQPPAGGYYPPQYMPQPPQAPQPQQPADNPYQASVQPPAAPPPPEPWEVDASLQPPLQPPWENNGDDRSKS